MSVAAPVLWMLLGPACRNAEGPQIEFVTVRDSVDLGLVSYEDPPPTGQYSIANSGGVTLLVSFLGLEGDGAELVEVSGLSDFTEIAPAEHDSVDITLVDDTSLWDEGSYEVTMVLQIGAFYNDPRDWSEDPTWLSQEVEVPITFELRCDVDGDGEEAAECAGLDCDDTDAAVAAPAEETCNGVDDDCDGEVDEDAVDATTWYEDADGDGYGDPATAEDACEAPSADSVDVGGDCDDADAAVSPDAAEADDGLDNDCDDLVDEDFLAAGDLVITEFMATPSGADDGREWIEVLAAGARDVDLSGIGIRVGDASAFVSPEAGLVLAPGERALLCQDRAVLVASAPTVGCDYEYGVEDDGLADPAAGPSSSADLVLPDDAGTIALLAGGLLLDEVDYSAGDGWPVVEGASASLDPAATDAAANDDPASWCSGSELYDSVDYGTPGTENPECP